MSTKEINHNTTKEQERGIASALFGRSPTTYGEAWMAGISSSMCLVYSSIASLVKISPITSMMMNAGLVKRF